jgi:serine/threonine protein kinase
MSLNNGDIIDGKYRIVRLLGEGGMGAVYEGENTRIHRRVAIKVLHSAVAENAEAVQRFEREAQAAGRIGSEHIVEVLDLGTLPNGDRYMVMEFLDGESLSERIRVRGRMAPAELYPLAVQMLEALSAAHNAGIVHRDLKPDNVFLLRTRGGRADFVKLLDFGISKFNQLSGDSGFSMTRTGAVMGTPYYMAPEQAKGARDLDQRVDLYAAGVILYEAITGRVPFHAETFNELLFKIVLESPQPVHQLVPDADAAFCDVITRAMAREPAQRFQSAAEFKAALDQWEQGGVPRPVPVAAPVRGGSSPDLPVAPATQGTWSQTSPTNDADVALPRKSRKVALVVASMVAVLIALIGGAFALKSRRDAAAAEVAEQRAAEERAVNEKRAAGERVQLDEERQAAERAKADAEQARREAERAAADAQKIKSAKGREEAERVAQEKARAAAEAEAKANQARARAVRTEASTRAVKKVDATAAKGAEPAPPKPAAPPPAAPAGRKIRTEL